MKESDIEQYLVRECKRLGIWCAKFVSPSHRGVPDRILIFPGGLVTFLELKAPGKRPTALQVAIRRGMEERGAVVSWADSKDMVDVLIRTWFN